MTASDGKKGAWFVDGTVIRTAVICMVIAAAVYKPLPAKMTEAPIDKIAMHFIEPVLRLSYYYPTRMCPDASCMLHWTRRSLGFLAWIVGPLFDADEYLHMETTAFDGVKVRVYTPKEPATAESNGAVVFIHGGGFALGNTEMYESLTRTMAKQMKQRLFVSVDYRLSPETFFPGGLEDCERVIEHIVKYGPEEYGIDPRKIVLMGDSAGGGLVASVTQRRLQRKLKPEILGQVLLYPLLQLSDFQTFSYRYFKREMHGLAVVDPPSVAMYYLWYAGVDVDKHPEYIEAAIVNGHMGEEAEALRNELFDLSVLPESFRDDLNGTDLRPAVEKNDELIKLMTPFITNPDFAPLMRRDLSSLPTAFIMTCELDVLRDEGAVYAHRLRRDGVRTTWKHYDHGFHAMLNFPHELEIAKSAIRDISDWTVKLIDGADF